MALSSAPSLVGVPLLRTGSRFAPANLSLMRERELQRRIDSKYTCSSELLHEILEPLCEDYAALPAGQGHFAIYHSLYFDTPDRRCFHDHRRGRRLRQKIRIRHYPDRHLTFLEVKTKRNEVLTDKQRLALEFGSEVLGEPELAFLRHHAALAIDTLQPTLRVNFARLSLVSLGSAERVTVDVGLRAHEPGGAELSFGKVAVIEVKQSPFCVRTPIMRRIHTCRLHERSMSKYTFATALLHPELRQNRLLGDVRAIERMIQ